MMEPLWSSVVATGGNRSQIGIPQKPQKQAKSVAAGCDPLRPGPHGKEGVDGSSPSEGFAKAPQIGTFSVEGVCKVPSMRWVLLAAMATERRSQSADSSLTVPPAGPRDGARAVGFRQLARADQS
jgi:hypothetical protein